MELRQLRHFVALADEMNFGQAARRLNMTQPAVSASIMRLEEDLGIQLFDRDNKRVALTRAGAAMLERAREIVAQSDRARHHAQSIADGRAGRIDVGFTGTLFYRGLGEILKSFVARAPAVELWLREETSQKQLELLRARQIDAAFINTPLAPIGLQIAVLHEEPFVACVPHDHPLADDEVIDLGALREERFVMFSRETARALHDHLVSLCANAGFVPKLGLEAAQLLSAVALVSTGLAVAVVPASMSRSGIPGVRYLGLRREVKRPSAFLVWHSDGAGPGLGELVDIVRARQHLLPARRHR